MYVYVFVIAKRGWSKWWSWKPCEFSPASISSASDSLAFCCFASQGNAVKSSVRMRNEAEELVSFSPCFLTPPFSPSLSSSLSVSLSILLISASLLFRQKLARDAKFRDFIDRKVPLARSFRRIFKKIALSVPARFIRIWNSLRTFRTRTGNEQEADLTSKIHL